MSQIRSSNTGPEFRVRRLVTAMGYHYRLQAKDLPGRPDLVFRGRRRVIFVHGCFWHQHGCRQYRMPKTKRVFWESKLLGNKLRDARVRRKLRQIGWHSLVIWECELRREERVIHRIRRFLES